MIVALDHLDMHRRNVAIARHNVIIEIRLLHRTVLEADAFGERQSDAVDDAALGQIVRAGVQAIDRGQWEAAASLGMSRLRAMRLVVLPQAIQRVVPPLAGQFISLVKDSSIVSLISVQELAFLGSEVSASTGASSRCGSASRCSISSSASASRSPSGGLERRLARGLAR